MVLLLIGATLYLPSQEQRASVTTVTYAAFNDTENNSRIVPMNDAGEVEENSDIQSTVDTTSEVMSSDITNADILRILSILAMLFGALLTTLGLVLPGNQIHHQTHTAGTAEKRVYKEKHEHK